MTIIRRAAFVGGSAAAAVLVSTSAAHAQTTTDTSTGFNPAVFVIFGVIFAIACAMIANSKGRSPVLWGILGFLFGLIPLIIILVLKKKQPDYATGYGSSPPPPPPPA